MVGLKTACWLSSRAEPDTAKPMPDSNLVILRAVPEPVTSPAQALQDGVESGDATPFLDLLRLVLEEAEEGDAVVALPFLPPAVVPAPDAAGNSLPVSPAGAAVLAATPGGPVAAGVRIRIGASSGVVEGRPAPVPVARPGAAETPDEGPAPESLAPLKLPPTLAQTSRPAPPLEPPEAARPVPPALHESSVAPLLSAGLGPQAASREGPIAPPAHVQIGHSLTSPQWGEALGQRVAWMSTREVQQASLHLNPPDLGPLEVRVTVHRGEASVLFGAHHAAVREAVDAALPRLREMLGDSGLTLVQVDVSGQQAGSQHYAGERGNGEHTAGGAMQPASAFVPAPDASAPIAQGAGIGLVDAFA